MAAVLYYYLIPSGTAADSFNSGNVGGATREAVTADPWGSPDDAVSYCQHDAQGGDGAVRFDMSDLPPGIQNIISVRLKIRTSDVDGNPTTVQALQRLGSSTQGASATTGAWADLLTAAFLLAPDGTPWTAARVNSLQVDVIFSGIAGLSRQDLTQVGLEVAWTPTVASGIESFRESISRRLRMRYLAPRRMEIVWPGLEWADVDPGQLFFLSHPDLPGPDSRGAGVKPGEPWPVRKISTQVDEKAMTETMIVEDWREILCTFWDVGKSRKAPIIYADGVPRLDAGNSRNWSRPFQATIVTPADTIVQVAFDTDRLDKRGMCLEAAHTNEIVHSAFKDGAANTYTGWTTAGTSVNGSSILDDTTELLFDPTTTQVLRSVKFAAGTPPGADLYVESTATASILANKICRKGIWHKDDSGQPLYFALRRNVDNNWWKESDQSWNASIVWNPMTVSTSRARYKPKQVNVGGSNTTLTLRVGLPSATAVGGQANHLYHAQLQQDKYLTSEILTESTAVASVADNLQIGNPSNAPGWPSDRGTVSWRLITEWDGADITAAIGPAVMTTFGGPGGFADFDWIYYNGASQRWQFVRFINNVVTATAVKAHVPVAGTEYRMTVRWVSTRGELGLAPYTLSLFVDGVKGTDAVASGPVRPADNGSIAIGATFDGFLSLIEATQQVRTDAQIGRY